MAFLNLANLGTSTFQKPYALNEDVRNFSEKSRYQIFLSYRHADRQYVPKIASFLKSLGTGIYVDFLDEELSKAPNNQTAAILRTRIIQSSKLIQLITPNSGQSKWMPWELGLGDGLLGYENSVTLPTINGRLTISDQDYLKLYGYIENGPSAGNTFNDWLIRYPDGQGIWFSKWLLK